MNADLRPGILRTYNLPGTGGASFALLHFIGIILMAIAGALSVCQALVLHFSTRSLSITLLAVSLLIGIAVSKSRGGFTSLIGIFFLTTVAFNLGRPILWLVFQDDRVYDLTFGATVSSSDAVKSSLLIFWCIGIAAFFGGYFTLYRDTRFRRLRLATGDRMYGNRCFWITLFIVAALIPMELMSNVKTVLGGGYTALYAGQTHYTFSWLRLEDFLVPGLFAIGVLISDRRKMRLVALVATAYVLAGVVVGERAAAGQWILIWIWYSSTIVGKRINRWLLITFGAAVIVAFQLIVIWREGQDSSITLVQFLVDQGITFLLPEISQWIPPPPIHTIISSLVPLGAIYSFLGIGSAETNSLGNYLSSHMSMNNFLEGNGLGGTFYLEIYYACGTLLSLFAAGCALGGLLLRRLEEAATRSRIALFYLCSLSPSIFLLPRGTISALTAEFIYLTVYLAGICGLIWLLIMSSRGEQPALDCPRPMGEMNMPGSR